MYDLQYVMNKKKKQQKTVTHLMKRYANINQENVRFALWDSRTKFYLVSQLDTGKIQL